MKIVVLKLHSSSCMRVSQCSVPECVSAHLLKSALSDSVSLLLLMSFSDNNTLIIKSLPRIFCEPSARRWQILNGSRRQ